MKTDKHMIFSAACLMSEHLGNLTAERDAARAAHIKAGLTKKIDELETELAPIFSVIGRRAVQDHNKQKETAKTPSQEEVAEVTANAEIC